MPNYTPNGLLLGYFEVDNMHNFVHIVSGVFALLAAASARYAKLYFQVFGIIYAVVTISGFWRAGDLYVMHVNMADNFLHLVIAVIAFYLGFIFKSAVD